MLKDARFRSRAHSVPFAITIDDIWVPDKCPVLGIPLSTGSGRATDASPSLDRILASKGYVKGNIIVVSNRANWLRGNATTQELKRLAEFYQGLSP
jgi:hypothetical protein